MVDLIPTLIDKQDNVEIIRDKIAVILATESVNQMDLAFLAGKDPNEWELRVFIEDSNSFEQFRGNNVSDRSPMLNVWFDTETVDLGASNTSKSQTREGFFNIDCYGLGVSADDMSGTGHTLGDRQAAFESQRAVRLVRNILMSATYTQLDLVGVVGRRMIQSITSFQPELQNQNKEQILGTRVALKVRYIEEAPQVLEDNLLEEIKIDVKRASDGRVLAELLYV